MAGTEANTVTTESILIVWKVLYIDSNSIS